MLAVLLLAPPGPSTAQETPHRATHLGNPATRFAPPLKSVEDLRRTLLREDLRDDVQTVARMSGYLGDMEDLRKAAAQAPVTELRIPRNTLLPAMSTRRKGKVDVLHNVLWAGKKPIEAYAFSFISGERRYRVVTPKACSNFWVEAQQPDPVAELALECSAPAEAAAGTLVELCCTLSNVGELAEPQATLALPYPANGQVRCVSGGPDVDDDSRLTWTFDALAPGAGRTVCANFTGRAPGPLEFTAYATARRASGLGAVAETRVTGQPAGAP
ncbi:MAG: hypothetical protein AB1899_12820 [Pseudomonadota bacterium]